MTTAMDETIQEKLNTLVLEIEEHVLATGERVSEAVRNGAMPNVRGRVRTELAIVGLAHLVNDRLSRVRQGVVSGSEGPAEIEGSGGSAPRRTANTGMPHPRDEIRFITFACGDGLLTFDEVPVDDLARLAADAEGKARAWRGRAAALRLAEQACRDGGVERLRDLDDEDTYTEILRAWRGE